MRSAAPPATPTPIRPLPAAARKRTVPERSCSRVLASCCSAARATSSGTTWMVLTAAEADLFRCGRSRHSWHGVWPKCCICGCNALVRRAAGGGGAGRGAGGVEIGRVINGRATTCESSAARCASSTASTSTAPWYVQ